MSERLLRSISSAILMLCVVLAMPHRCLPAGKLGQVSQEVRSPNSPSGSGSGSSGSDSPSNHSSYSSFDDDDDGLEIDPTFGLGSWMFEKSLTGLVSGTAWLVFDRDITERTEGEHTDVPDRHEVAKCHFSKLYFSRWPYCRDTAYAVPACWFDPPQDVLPPESELYEWASTLQTDYMRDIEGVDKLGQEFRIEHSSGFGIEADWNYWWEPDGTDELRTGDANVTYIVHATDRVLIRMGVGGNWLHDSIGTEAGFNFTTSWRRYHRSKTSFGFDLDVGRVGKATKTHYRFTVGKLVNRWNFYVGYDYTKFGRVEGISGPIGGIQVHF